MKILFNFLFITFAVVISEKQFFFSKPNIFFIYRSKLDVSVLPAFDGVFK